MDVLPPADAPTARPGVKSAQAFRTIAEVARELDLPQHVLRFWETKFPQIKPLKRRGGRRYYRPADVALLARVRGLLYQDGYTIRGVQKLLRDTNATVSAAATAEMPPASTAEVPAVDLCPSDDVRPVLREILDELRSIRALLVRAR